VAPNDVTGGRGAGAAASSRSSRDWLPVHNWAQAQASNAIASPQVRLFKTSTALSVLAAVALISASRSSHLAS